MRQFIKNMPIGSILMAFWAGFQTDLLVAIIIVVVTG